MRGTSSASLREVTQHAGSLMNQVSDLAPVADELFDIADVIDSSNQAVRLLSDPGRDPELKKTVVRNLLEGKVSQVPLEVTQDVVAHRWSEQEDILEALEQVGIEALLDQASRDGVLERVEEELFQTARLVDTTPALAEKIDDPRTGSAERAALLGGLLEAQVHPVTLTLVRRAVGRRSETKYAQRLLGFAEFASERRRRLLAVVTSAHPMSTTQQERLGAILSKIYGREVQMNLDVSDDVVGGLRIQVGDDLYDATVLARLHEARHRLAA